MAFAILVLEKDGRFLFARIMPVAVDLIRRVPISSDGCLGTEVFLRGASWLPC